MAASRGNYVEVVETLLAHGANISARDKRGFTALVEASRENCVDVVRLLLSSGADPNVADYDERTPLWWACINGHVILPACSWSQEPGPTFRTRTGIRRLGGHV